MIQHSTFPDGGFVLHKVMVNGSKYSVWYAKTGKPHAAERFSKNGMIAYNVDLVRQHNIADELERAGRPYVAR